MKTSKTTARKLRNRRVDLGFTWVGTGPGNFDGLTKKVRDRILAIWAGAESTN